MTDIDTEFDNWCKKSNMHGGFVSKRDFIAGWQACQRRIDAQRDRLLDVDSLAQIIRKVDGNHDLGAGALAEALIAEIEAEK